MCLLAILNGMITLKLLIVKPAAIGDNRGVSLTRNTVLFTKISFNPNEF